MSKNRHTEDTNTTEPTTAEDDEVQKTPRTGVARSSLRAGDRVESRATEGFLENLFSSARNQSLAQLLKSQYSRTEGPEVSKDPKSPHSRHELLTTWVTWVDRLPAKSPPLDEQWSAFMQAYGSQDSNRDHLSSHPDHDRFNKEKMPRNPEREVLRVLLLRLTNFHVGRHSHRTQKLPTPAEAIRTCVKAGIMEDLLWERVLWILLGAIVKLRAKISKGERERGSLNYYHFSRKLLNDTLEVWRLFVETFAAKSSQSRNTISQDSSSNAANAHLDCLSKLYILVGEDVTSKGTLAAPELAAACVSSQIHLPDRFLSFLPQLRGSESIRQVSAAAVMTLDLLCLDSQQEGIHGPQAAYEKEFVEFMASVVTMKHMEFDVAQRCLTREKVPSETIRRLGTSWERLPQRARVLSSSAEGSNAGATSEAHVTHKGNRSQTDTAIKSSFLIKAVKSGDLNAIDGLWQRMEAVLSRGIINDHLFGQFLWAYTCLRRPVQATHVWNRMIELGRNPSQEHWLAMLRGCKQAKDYNAMRDIWQRMNAFGIRPGLRCWTIRIQGLILSGQWPQGLKALDELSKVWDSAALPATRAQSIPEESAANQLGGETKDLLVPSIVPINAAITSLLAIGSADVVGTFLKWAELHKIRPDTATFNILLRRAIRGHQPGNARNILHQMESFQCQPDIHTFTIIIDGLFRNPGSAFRFEESEAQVAAVADIFRQMKDIGIEPSVYTFSSMLDGLLGANSWQRNQINVAAARAVLDHMAGEGIKPSPHIYTILISHYFNLDPPDLPSIDGLWNRMQLEGSTRDHIFYDRMIEGYARVGAVEKMLAFLRRMPQEGKSPGWVALHAVLQSLVRAHEWDMVQDLVRDVGGTDGIFRNTLRFSWGKKDFWDLVDDVRRRGIALPEVEVDDQR